MKYFFVSGYLGIQPFDMVVSTKDCYPKRSDIVDLIRGRNPHSGHSSGRIIILNIIPMTEEEYNIWRL